MCANIETNTLKNKDTDNKTLNTTNTANSAANLTVIPNADKAASLVPKNNANILEFEWDQFPEKYANTTPLGLIAFGLTTVLLSFSNVNAYKMNSMIIGMGIFYGGMAQFVAGTFEIREGHTFGGVAFCSYGAFWLSFCTIVCGNSFLGVEVSNYKSTGTFLLFWCVFTIFMFIALLKNGAMSERLIFGTLAITFLLLSIGEYAESKGTTKAGGAFGLLCGAIAIYTGCATVINSDQGTNILPL